MNNSTRNPNGRVLPFFYVKQHRDELLPVLSEGSDHLYRILDYCISNNIPTIACCAGHNIFDNPYISIEYNQGNKRKLNAVLNRLEKINGVSIMFSTRYAYNNFNVTIYTNRKNRDLVFNIIATILENNLEDDTLIDDYKIALDLALKKDDYANYTSITIFNKLLRRKYMLRVGMRDADNNIIKSVKRYRTTNQSVNAYFYMLSKRKLNIVCSQLLVQAINMTQTVHENARYSDIIDSETILEDYETSKKI